MAAESLKKSFKPAINFFELEYFLEGKDVNIHSNSLFKLANKLTNSAYPSHKDKFEKRWEYFYLPSKRSGKTISIPFGILRYGGKFYLYFGRLGQLSIGMGKERTENIYKKILNESIKFSKVIKKTKSKIVEITVPYDLRTGKIKGKYIMKKPLLKKEKEQLYTNYKKHLKKGLKVSTISLHEYLAIAGVCYRTAFESKTNGMSCKEMYRKWADGRDGGMLSIQNKNSKKEFMEWLKSGKHIGAHPFEIVFSWLEHGIHLYPPDKNRPYFSLSVTNYGYAWSFIKMVNALIKKKVPFQAIDIENVLEYLSGETYFTVNDYDKHFFFYAPSKKEHDLYFHHINWDKLKIARFK